MKFKYLLAFLAATWLIMVSGYASLASAQGPIEDEEVAGSKLTILSATANEAILELTVTEFQVETLDHAGQSYQRLHIPGMIQTDQPGEPQLPSRGTMLGVASTTDVAVEILEADSEILTGYRIYPAPGLEPVEAGLVPDETREVFTLDQALYATPAFYPNQPVEIGHTGIIRGQAVAQVQFYPVQFNPVSGELRSYRRLVVRVTWDTPLQIAESGAQPGGVGFENLLKDTLLNYDALGRPTPTASPSLSTSGGEVGLMEITTPTLKLGITQEGVYQLTPSDLTGGLAGAAVSTLKIKHKEVEIPIFVHDDNSNNIFDGADYLLFYGVPITHTGIYSVEKIYTTKNYYWLEAGGDAGQRITSRFGTPGGAQIPAHFPVTQHFETDTLIWLTMLNRNGQDDWFWQDRISPNTAGLPTFRDYTTTNLDNLSDLATTLTLTVKMKGFTGLGHKTRVKLNGTTLGEELWSQTGQISYTQQVSGSHDLLQSGINTVTVEALDSGDALPHQTLVNWFELSYWDTYVADNDSLLFGAPQAGAFQFEITNFQTNTIQVFDVTSPTNIVLITDTTVVSAGGSYKLQFQDTAQANSTYLALTPAKRKTPVSIELLTELSSWKSPNNQADYIIITHKDFYDEVLPLASHRSITSGLQVATVKYGDILNEFNGGVDNPQAIYDFLRYAYTTWQAPAPEYVLLVGDATYDYRDIFGSGVNYVPSLVVESGLFGQVPSDNGFVALDGGNDILPDMFIGRLPARTASGAANIVDKIIGYDTTNAPDASWNSTVLLVADDDEFSFEAISEQIAGKTPYYYTNNKVYVDDYPPDDPTTDISAYINSGSLLVNYTGHGNFDGWGLWDNDNTRFFLSSNISNLTNTGKLPMVIAANCLNGFFATPNTNDSMAERFLNLKDKGAVAVWAATSLGYPSGHRVMMGEFYDTIFQNDEYAVGQATTSAKYATLNQSSVWGELLQTFVLFGDPATKLGLPLNPPYVKSVTPADGANDVFPDQPIQLTFNKVISPSTAILTSAQATGPFTPTWFSDNTFVSYEHPNFSFGQTVTFTISAQDLQGSNLITGPNNITTTWSFTVVNEPPLAVTKKANVDAAKVGQTITYTYRVTNTSSITLLFVTAQDDKLGSAPLGLSTLTSGQSTTATLTYTVMANDLPGPIMNTVVATGTSQATFLDTTGSATESVMIITDPAITVTKTPNITVVDAGQIITYTYRVTNTGDVSLTLVTAEDNKLGAVALGQTTLSPGTGTSGSLTYTVATGDRPTLTNTVTVTSLQGASAIATASVAVNQDDDGVPDTVENEAPNNGDGNGDNIKDSAQEHVTSLPNHNGDAYVTMVATPATATLKKVQAVANPSPGDAPAGVDFSQGFFDFEIEGIGPGDAVTVTMIFTTSANPDSYWKYGPTPENTSDHWYEFDFNPITGTGAITGGHVMTLTFIDGIRGDSDLTANGRIDDPGGPGVQGSQNDVYLPLIIKND